MMIKEAISIKGLKLFTALAILTFVFLFIFTATEETFTVLKRVKLEYFVLSFLCLGIYIILEATRIRLIIHAITGKRIPLWSAIQFIFCGAFLSAITPFQAGGAPLQMYILRKTGMEWGDILLTLVLRGVFYLLSALTISLIFLPYFLQLSPYSIGMLSWYAVFTYFLLFTLFFIILFRPKGLKKLLYRCSIRKGRKTRFTYHLFRLFRVIKEMKKGLFLLWTRKKLFCVFIVVFTIMVYLPVHSIAYMILKGLGQEVPYPEVILKQVALLIMAFFFPTPGAEGMMEGGFFLLFKGEVPPHIIGIFTMMWRFITYHVVVIAGGFFTLSLIKTIPGKGTK